MPAAQEACSLGRRNIQRTLTFRVFFDHCCVSHGRKGKWVQEECECRPFLAVDTVIVATEHAKCLDTASVSCMCIAFHGAYSRTQFLSHLACALYAVTQDAAYAVLQTYSLRKRSVKKQIHKRAIVCTDRQTKLTFGSQRLEYTGQEYHTDCSMKPTREGARYNRPRL